MRLFRRRATGLVPLHHFHFNLRFPEALDRIHPLNAVLNGPFAAHHLKLGRSHFENLKNGSGFRYSLFAINNKYLITKEFKQTLYP